MSALTSHVDVSCPLCQPTQERVLWQDNRCRVIQVGDVDYPGFCRVVWTNHVKEMTDLTKSQRAHFLNVVYAMEQVLRGMLRPRKMNLASFGNQMPHLHWHVIPRFEDDPHYPDSIWSARKRPGNPRAVDGGDIARALYARLGGRKKKPA